MNLFSTANVYFNVYFFLEDHGIDGMPDDFSIANYYQYVI